jgi:hypothetical protein
MNKQKRRWPLPWWLHYLTPLGAVILTGFFLLILTLMILAFVLSVRNGIQ